MARAELDLNLKVLEDFIATCQGDALKTQLSNVIGSKDVAGLVAQAIAQNFKDEGPGWKPLKAQTIRNSVSKKKAKMLKGMSDREILQHEAFARTPKGKSEDVNPNRQILRKTSLLMKSVTTPGAAHNINQVSGSNLIWGTNLIYAAVHNYGATIKNPGTNNGFGRGIKIPPHNIKIDQREFLVLTDKWKIRIQEYALNEMARIVKLFLEGP